MSERVKRYAAAMADLDSDALGELRHPDFECFYPQSGERFVGHEAWAGAHRDYVSRFGKVYFDTVKGGEQRAAVTNVPSVMPFISTNIVQVSDTGDLVTLEGSGTWPDGKLYYWVQILEYRDGLVWRETDYFAEPFDAPEWRAEFTKPTSG